MNTVKPVSLEMELDYHERLLQTVGKSIQQTKKRLHDAELILNLRPPDHEPAEIQEWSVKVSQLIDKRPPLEFPTLYKVRKEYENKALIKSIRTGRQKIESDEKFNQRMNRILAKEAEMIKKKVLSESASFGKKVVGESIKTIDGYKGGNTMYSGSRTLIVKEGSYIPPDPNSSSLPTWMGPGYYPDAAKIPKFAQHDAQYRVPFKAQSRDATSEEVQKRSAQSRRRRQISECKTRISTSSENGRHSRAGTESLESFYTAFGEGSSALTRSRAPLETALELARKDNLGEDAQLEIRFDEDDGGGSLASSITLNSSLRSRNSTAGGNKKLTVGFVDESLNQLPQQSEVSTPRTATSSLFSQVRSKSILKSRLRKTAPPPKKQAPILNPIYSRKDLTMKMLKLDERTHSLFFKVKDYTMNAFALHSPTVDYVDEFEPADAPGEMDPAAGVYQTRSNAYRKSKPIGTFTSEIFTVKPPEYVPHKPGAVDTRPSSTTTVTSATTDTDDSHRVQTGADLTSAAAAAIKASESTKSPVVTASRAQSYSTNHTNITSNTISKKNYKPAVLSIDIEKERYRSERTVDKIIQRRHDSRYFDMKNHTLTDDASVSSADSAAVPSIAGAMQNLNITSRRSMDKWFDNNNIIRTNKQKSRVEGASFLREHKPLPSIALSLNGLLLEENPYGPDDELIREMFHRPASEIGL